MTTPDYDIITVGGGLGGSALAKAMAEHGHRVLVIEREPQFKDRVRGEVIFPWGVQEAKSLGLYGTLITAGAHHPTYWDDYAGPDSLGSRDYAEDTPQKVRCLCIYHPRLQEALLQASEAAGAEVRRGTRVKLVEPGLEPKVVVEGDGPAQTLTARLVEPPREKWRLQVVRGWSNEKTGEVSSGDSGTGGAPCAGAPGRVPVTVGGDQLDRREVRNDAGDAAQVGAAG